MLVVFDMALKYLSEEHKNSRDTIKINLFEKLDVYELLVKTAEFQIQLFKLTYRQPLLFL